MSDTYSYDETSGSPMSRCLFQLLQLMVISSIVTVSTCGAVRSRGIPNMHTTFSDISLTGLCYYTKQLRFHSHCFPRQSTSSDFPQYPRGTHSHTMTSKMAPGGQLGWAYAFLATLRSILYCKLRINVILLRKIN